MRLKKAVSLLFSSLFSIPFVFARETSYMPEPIERALTFLFIKMERYAASGDELFVIYAKFLLFIMIFALFHYGASKIFKDKNRVSGVIGFILALMTTILMPKNILIFMFNTYSVVVGFILALLPVFIGLYIAHASLKEDTRFNRLMKAIIMIIIAVVTFGFAGLVTEYPEGPTELYAKLGQWAGAGGALALIVGIWYLVRCFGVGGAAGALSGGGTRAAKDNEAAEREGDEETTLSKRERTALKRLEGIEKREFEDIKKVINDLKTIKGLMKTRGSTEAGHESISEKLHAIQGWIYTDEEILKGMRELIGYIDKLETVELKDALNEKIKIQDAFKVIAKDKKLGLDSRNRLKASASRKIINYVNKNITDTKKIIVDVRTKVEAEYAKISEFEKQFVAVLNSVYNEFAGKNIQLASKHVDVAIKIKEDQQRILSMITREMIKVRRLENHEFRDLKNKRRLEIELNKLGL